MQWCLILWLVNVFSNSAHLLCGDKSLCRYSTYHSYFQNEVLYVLRKYHIFTSFHYQSLSWPALRMLAGLQTQMRGLSLAALLQRQPPSVAHGHQLTAMLSLEFVNISQFLPYEEVFRLFTVTFGSMKNFLALRGIMLLKYVHCCVAVIVITMQWN